MGVARRLTPELPETTAGLGRDSVIALDLLPPRLYMRYALRPGHPHPDACGRISYEEKRGGGGLDGVRRALSGFFLQARVKSEFAFIFRRRLPCRVKLLKV